MYQKKEISGFRQRGFKCTSCQVSTIIYGNDPAPTVCPCHQCVDGALVLRWDHDVTQTTEVVDHVEVTT